MTKLTRDKNLAFHLVTVRGHFGKPQVGIQASRRRTHYSTGIKLVDVIVTRSYPGAPVERLTARDSWVTTVSPANSAAVPTADFEAILQNLVDAGSITRGERRAAVNFRKRVLRQAAKDCTRIPYYWPWHEPHNLGAGQMTKSFIAANGLWR